jgi:hypothetical protein
MMPCRSRQERHNEEGLMQLLFLALEEARPSREFFYQS